MNINRPALMRLLANLLESPASFESFRTVGSPTERLLYLFEGYRDALAIQDVLVTLSDADHAAYLQAGDQFIAGLLSHI